MSEIPKEEKEEPKPIQNVESPAPTLQEPKEEINNEEDKKEENPEKEEKEEIPENLEKEENPEKEEDNKNEDKQEEDKNKEGKEEKELTANEEDKKEIYDAIKDLKPEEASSNVKSKLLLLSDVHFEFLKIKDDNYGVEYDSLTDKYDKKFLELDEKIESIVTTKEKEKIEISKEEKEKYGITDDDTEIKEIEDYWEKVILNSRYFSITDKDKKILKYLHKVKMVKFSADNKNNINDFRIDFYFKENEFFSNEILSKTYIYQKDATLKKAEGTKINWKSPDKNTTIEKVRKKVKRGKRYVNEEKEKIVDSFFSFFQQVDDMTFLTDEVTFFKDDLFMNQLEYYLDIATKTKNGGFDDGEDYDDNYDDNYNDGYYYDKNDHGRRDDRYGGNDGKKEECKQQ